jgi:hypothetical protein
MSIYHTLMCSHYQAMKDRERYRRHFGVEPPDDLGKFDVWPMHAASFIRRSRHADAGDEAVPARDALPGQFGLIPHWATDTTIARHTYNARSETVASKPSFRDAGRHGQRGIVPAEAFYEPDWRSGKAVPTHIARTDGSHPKGCLSTVMRCVWRHVGFGLNIGLSLPSAHLRQRAIANAEALALRFSCLPLLLVRLH